MRQILFRGRSVKTGQWVYGYYAEQHMADYDRQVPDRVTGYTTLPVIFSDQPGQRSQGSYWTEVDQRTVGQFTGMTDSMNVRIFEGDTVHVAMSKYDREGRLYYATDMADYYRGLVAWNPKQCRFEVLLEENEVGQRHHIVSCEIGWGHESFLVAGQYIDNPFPLERDRQERKEGEV